MRAFGALLGAFVGGRVDLHHYAARSDAGSALRRAGFPHVAVEPAIEIARSAGRLHPGARLAYVAQAAT